MTITTDIICADWINSRIGANELIAIPRYSLYPVMYYRTSILDHTKRVLALARELMPQMTIAFGDRFDSTRTEALAIVHDDIEIIIGDIQAGNKAKMTPAQQNQLEKEEYDARTLLAQNRPPKLLGYGYIDLLNEVAEAKTLESMLIQYVDKLDAFGEALHEIYAGNRCFMTNVENEYGVIDIPTDHYVKYFNKFLDKYPTMASFFQQNLPITLIPHNPDFNRVVENGKPATELSIQQPTGYLHYDFWKSTLLKHSDIVDLAKLYNQVEF